MKKNVYQCLFVTFVAFLLVMLNSCSIYHVRHRNIQSEHLKKLSYLELDHLIQKKIKINTDAIEQFGRPYELIELSDGTLEYRFHSVENSSNNAPPLHKKLRIFFDSNGKLKYWNLFHSWQPKISEKVIKSCNLLNKNDLSIQKSDLLEQCGRPDFMGGYPDGNTLYGYYHKNQKKHFLFDFAQARILKFSPEHYPFMLINRTLQNREVVLPYYIPTIEKSLKERLNKTSTRKKTLENILERPPFKKVENEHILIRMLKRIPYGLPVEKLSRYLGKIEDDSFLKSQFFVLHNSKTEVFYYFLLWNKVFWVGINPYYDQVPVVISFIHKNGRIVAMYMSRETYDLLKVRSQFKLDVIWYNVRKLNLAEMEALKRYESRF